MSSPSPSEKCSCQTECYLAKLLEQHNKLEKIIHLETGDAKKSLVKSLSHLGTLIERKLDGQYCKKIDQIIS